MENKKGMLGAGMFVVVLILLIFLFIMVLLSITKEKNTSYEMPNGIICKDKIESRGLFSGVTSYEFSDCPGNIVYLNPSYWKEIKED